ncbi:MAG: dTDP-glucose 4,6-dehydratase [Acidobacteria bacterium]|nr:dTDP-glucose 4,6-dehydratase [Acidobacteriota bacterium]
MRKVLVTGGAGFIGSNFVHYLLNKDSHAQIFNLDALTYAGNLANLAGLPDAQRHQFIEGDIADFDKVKELLRQQAIDTVIHFAAESHVDRSISGPTAFVQTNVNGTLNLLEAVRHVWVNEKLLPLEAVRFHHVSTDEVYGTLAPDDPAFAETTPYSPNSPYAASKAASDHLVRAYHHTYGLPITITNCSNNYGPYQFPEKLIPVIVLNALEGKPLPIYGDGQQIRDWLYVEDHCAAIHLVATQGQVGETYNIGGNTQPTNLEIVKQICAILDELRPDAQLTPREQLITYVKDRPGHDRRYAIDGRKIARELGWTPSESLATGLRKTIQWYLDNSEWLAGVRQKQEYQSWVKNNYQQRAASPSE